MKLKHFAEDGFSHILVPLAVVVGVGIIGSFLLVVTHADPISGTGTCSISGVPKVVAVGEAVSPLITVKNTGSSTYGTEMNGSTGLSNGKNGKGGGFQFNVVVRPGESKTSKPGVAGTVYGEKGYKVVVTAKSNNVLFSCKKSSNVTT